MKKALIAMLLIIGAVIPAFAGTEYFVVEKFIPEYELQPSMTDTLYTVTFSIPSSGHAVNYTLYRDHDDFGCLLVDGDSLKYYGWTRVIPLGEGEHTVHWVVSYGPGDPAMKYDLLFQLMIFYHVEDEPSVTEQSPDHNQPVQRSIISQGPTVTVPGCTGVYDKTGSKVDCEISGDRVYLDPLPAGTYFLRQRETTSATKITKVH